MQLNLPEQRFIPGVDTRPAPLRSWLKALPYVETHTSGGQVLERLHDINHQRLPAKQRLELLAAFRDSYDRLHEMLRDQARQLDPLTQPQALNLLTELTEQMGYGYKYALRDALDEGQRWGKSRQVAEAANYAQHFLALHLLCLYQAYQPVPDPAWHELGDLVRFAETEALATTRDGDFPYSCGELSVIAAYRQLALLRLADPYRLPNGLIWEAYGYLSRKCAQILLLKNFDDTLPTGVFGVSLDHEPYESRPAPTTGVERASWRCLDARELLHSAQVDLDRIVNGTHPHRIGFSNQLTGADAIQLLGRMVGQWTHSYQRKQPRFNASVQVELSPGLDAAYYFLNNCVAFDPETFAPPEDEDSIDFSVTGLRSGRVSEQDYRLVCCTTRNRGGGGISLKLGQQEGLSLRVGQLLLINAPGLQANVAAPTTTADWLIGVVRWLVNHGGKDTEVGIQYVARNCSTAVIRPTSGHLRTFMPALRNELTLPNGQRLDVLIAPKGVYRNKGMLELQLRGQTKQIQCNHLLESGNSFERFSFDILA